MAWQARPHFRDVSDLIGHVHCHLLQPMCGTINKNIFINLQLGEHVESIVFSGRLRLGTSHRF